MSPSPIVLVNVISGAPRPVLEQCLVHLDSARRAAHPHVKVHVLFVDNSGSAAERWVADAHPDWDYVAQPQPRGFATNANLALRQAADYALLLNSDAFLRTDTLPQLLGALDRHADWAAVSAHLQNPDGSDQGTAFDFPDLRSTLSALTGARRACFLHGCRRKVSSADVATDWVPAACLLIRGAAIAQVGLLDEGFDPGYGEDIDWCRRAHRAGWRIGVCAAARVTHLGGASFGALGAEQFALFVRHLCRYHHKHRPHWAARALAMLIATGLAARALSAPQAARFRPGARAALSFALHLRQS